MNYYNWIDILDRRKIQFIDNIHVSAHHRLLHQKNQNRVGYQ